MIKRAESLGISAGVGQSGYTISLNYKLSEEKNPDHNTLLTTITDITMYIIISTLLYFIGRLLN